MPRRGQGCRGGGVVEHRPHERRDAADLGEKLYQVVLTWSRPRYRDRDRLRLDGMVTIYGRPDHFHTAREQPDIDLVIDAEPKTPSLAPRSCPRPLIRTCS